MVAVLIMKMYMLHLLIEAGRRSLWLSRKCRTPCVLDEVVAIFPTFPMAQAIEQGLTARGGVG